MKKTGKKKMSLKEAEDKYEKSPKDKKEDMKGAKKMMSQANDKRK